MNGVKISSMHETLNQTTKVMDDIGNERDSLVNLYMNDLESITSRTRKRVSMVLGLNETDQYGFKKRSNQITVEEYDKWWAQYSVYCHRRRLKWEKLMNKSGIPMTPNVSPAKFPPRSEKLRRYIRKGIPADWRADAWWYFARGDEMLSRNKGCYQKLLDKFDTLPRSQLPDLEVIERDLHRTFPDNIHFHRESYSKEEPLKIQSLRRVLIAFSIYDQDIGYCQSMNFIAGLLLLFMDEEKAFWMLVIITKKYLPGVHSIDLEGVNVDQGVLLICIKQYMPEFWSKIEQSIIYSNGGNINLLKRVENSCQSEFEININEVINKLPPITLSTASWFMSCFIGVVPIETTLRIWDCLFYEKSHFLFKVSLAILKLGQDNILHEKKETIMSQMLTFATNSQDSLPTSKVSNNSKPSITQDDYDILLFEIIQNYPKRLINPNDLFDKIIFKKKLPLNQINQEEIDKIRKYVQNERRKRAKLNKILGDAHDNNSNYINNSNASRYSKLSHDEITETIKLELPNFSNKQISGFQWNETIKDKLKYK